MSGEGASDELALARLVERFGAEAVFGRAWLYSYELRRILLAERVARAYAARAKAVNWAAWAQNNGADAELLADIETRLKNG